MFPRVGRCAPRLCALPAQLGAFVRSCLRPGGPAPRRLRARTELVGARAYAYTCSPPDSGLTRCCARTQWVGDERALGMSPGWLGIGCHQVNGSASQDDPNNHNGNPHNHRRSIPITAGCIVQWRVPKT